MYDDLVKKIRHCATDPMHCLSFGEDKDGRCFKRLMTQAADAIEELSKPRWISVNERMPEPGVPVLAVADWKNEPGVLYGIRWNGTEWEVELVAEYDYWERYAGKITHWMPLPELPEEE